MKTKTITHFIFSVPLAIMILSVMAMTGCSDNSQNNSSPPTLEEAMLANPDLALKILPTTDLDISPPTTETISTATLESNYETIFGQCSTKLGVTLSSSQNVEKINYIKTQPDTGYFNLLSKPIQNNPLGIQSVYFQSVLYSTTVPLPAGVQTFNVSGGLTMPNNITKGQIKGVLVYFHATQFNKQMVGSNIANEETQLVLQLFASQGYIVVMPDYVGQGVDWNNVHPYVLYPQVTAKTAVDMLTAVKPTIEDYYNFVGGESPLKVFSLGYSEGGAYSVWFRIYNYANPAALDPFYTMTHSVGCEGAYSLSNVTKGFLFDDVNINLGNHYNIQHQFLANMVKPVLSGDAFISYATYTMNSDYDSVFNKDWFNLDCPSYLEQKDCNVCDKHQNIAQAFDYPSTSPAGQLLLSAFDKTANLSIYPGPATIAVSPLNSVNALVSSALLRPAGQAQLNATLKAADVDLSSMPDESVSIISLQNDSVVVPNNFDYIYSTYPEKLKAAIKLDQKNFMVVSPFSSVMSPLKPSAVWVPADHMHALIYEFIYALNIFNSF